MGEGSAAIFSFLKLPSSSSSSSSSSSVYLRTSSTCSSFVFANSLPQLSLCPFPPISISHSTKRVSNFLAMDGDIAAKAVPLGFDTTMEEEYTSQSKLLLEFTRISTIDKAWTFKSDTGKGSRAMFLISQPDLLANKKRKYILSAHISKDGEGVTFQWAPFPIEMTGASAIVPSPSGSKLLVIRAPDNESPTKFEVWGSSQLEKEFHVPQSVHGSIYTDGWFEGISWNADETLIAYVAEEPSPPKPTFNSTGYKQGASSEKDCSSWKGLGEWEEEWGETYAGKRRPAIFVININSGETRAVEGIKKTLSVGQPVWSPPVPGLPQCLVFVGWPGDKRKLGMKYCYNRPCALYAVSAQFHDLESGYLQAKGNEREDSLAVKLTEGISSAFHPRFSPDGKFLVFISAKSSVDSGAHSATNSLHRIDWPADGKPCPSANIVEVIPVVMCPEDDCFPGLYSSSISDKPWISDGQSIIMPSIWGSTQVILSVNILSGNVVRISPADSNSSWNVLTLEGDNIIAVYSSPVDIPQIKYGSLVKASKGFAWNWLDVSNSISKGSEKVGTLLSSLQFSIMKIPVREVSQNVTKGAQKPFEAIYICSKSKKSERCDPLIVVLHGGPHSVSLSSFSKALAFLSCIGYSLLLVNYRGSVGFGEEALQSLPGNIGSQDVNDVLAAIDHVINLGFADPSKIAVLGGSHGGFLTTHLIGQAPDKFIAAAARNPVCNIASMVGISDIPDWCFVEAYGSQGNINYTEAPTAEHLNHLYKRSPISHISKVKTPTLLLLGAQDLRVPVSNGLQYARALKEKGVVNKVILFPNDNHAIDRPQSDFESFLNIGVWFKKYCK